MPAKPPASSLRYGGPGPVFGDGTFEYIPIPERPRHCGPRSVYFRDLPAGHGGTLAEWLPRRWRDAAAHHDPEFETFTYGDPTRNKRSQLRRFGAGDVVAFCVGLRPPRARRGGRVYVIGYFPVDEVLTFEGVTGWPPSWAGRVLNNAHLPRPEPEPDLVVVRGDPRWSRLHERAVPISDEVQYATDETRERLGLDGPLKRAVGRWVPPRCVDTGLAGIFEYGGQG